MVGEYLAGGAILTFIISTWSYIKMYMVKVLELFVVTINLNGYSTSLAESYVRNNFKQSKICQYSVLGTNEYVNKLKRSKPILSWSTSKNSITFYRKGCRFLILKSTSEDKGSNQSLSISFLRFTFNVLDLLKNIEETKILKNDSSRFRIIKHCGMSSKSNINNRADITSQAHMLGDSPQEIFYDYVFWKQEDIGLIKVKNQLKDILALSPEAEESIKEIVRWKESEEWYKERSIPWKRGICLSGKPGNGKSSFTRFLAMELDLVLNVFDISTMNNQEFQEKWKNSLQTVPCINLIEDIDAVFDGRKNVVNAETGLTFDCLLNTIDGVDNTDGVLTVITTNHIDKIDDAIGNINGDNISTRPGRVDRVVVMVPPDEEGRRKIAKRILTDYPEEIDRLVTEGDHDSGAQFQERCSRLALSLYWKNKT